MDDQSVVKVRFFKSRKIAFWRIFGEMNEMRIKHLCNQMTLFNNHHNVMFCVVDFKRASLQVSPSILTDCLQATASKSTGCAVEIVHIVLPEQNHHVLCNRPNMAIDAIDQPMTTTT